VSRTVDSFAGFRFTGRWTGFQPFWRLSMSDSVSLSRRRALQLLTGAPMLPIAA